MAKRTSKMGPYARKGNEPRAKRITQKGTRVVNHVGGRELASPPDETLMAVIPTLPHETVRDLRMMWAGITDDEEQPDSIMEVDTVVFWAPRDWMHEAVSSSSSALETELAELYRDAGTVYDPNPGANVVPELFGTATGVEFLYQKREFCWPLTTYRYQNGFTGGAETTIARAFHGFRRNVELAKRRRFEVPGLLCFMAFRDLHTAQTDFGVLDADNLANDVWNEFFGGVDYDEIGAPGQQLQEMLYRGDTYIEADTWKDTSVRCYLDVTATIGTPWPRNQEPALF